MPFCIAVKVKEELRLKTSVKWFMIYSGHSGVVEQAQDECNYIVLYFLIYFVSHLSSMKSLTEYVIVN